MDETKKMRIAALADIHVREGDKGKWTDLFKEVSSKADVLIIAGDLTDTGDETEAQVLADELKACTVPVVAVLGNHDYTLDPDAQVNYSYISKRWYMPRRYYDTSIVIGHDSMLLVCRGW